MKVAYNNCFSIKRSIRINAEFAFDATNRMTYAVTGKGSAQYTYNGFLARVGKLEKVANIPDPESEVRYTLDMTLPYDNLLMMRESDKEQSFVWGNGLVSSLGDERFHYLQDHLGSPIRLMGDGEVSDVLAFDEFGVPTISSQQTANPFGFTGYQSDDISGLWFAQARYYVPQVGRFSAEDTHWNPGNMIFGDDRRNRFMPSNNAILQSANLYSYVMNRPLDFFDPKGEDAIYLTDRNGAFRQGHSSVLLQDSDGTWHHVNFGPGEGGGNSKGVITMNEMALPDTVSIVDGRIENSRQNYTRNEIRANSGQPTGLERYFDQPDDFQHYIHGDFLDSLERARWYVENQSGYQLTGLNCAWMTADILMASYDKNSIEYRNIYNALWNFQYVFNPNTRQHELVIDRRLIHPNSFNAKVEELFGSQKCEVSE